MVPNSLYSYVWQISREAQIRICLLVAVVAPLTAVPLELQRQIVDHAVASHEVWLLAAFGAAYLAVILVQGGLKYLLNLGKGRVLEMVSRDLRRRILERRRELSSPDQGTAPTSPVDSGTTVSILAAETEDIGGFASESLVTPLLQVSTILWVFGYLVWVEPLIAGLAILVYAPQVFLVPRVQAIVNRLARRRIALVRRLGRLAVDLESIPEAQRPGWWVRSFLLTEHIFKTRILIYRYKYFLTFLGNLLDALGPLIVLVVGGYLVIKDQTNVSTFVVFISGFQKLADPWDQLINFYRSVSNARVSYSLVFQALAPTSSRKSK